MSLLSHGVGSLTVKALKYGNKEEILSETN